MSEKEVHFLGTQSSVLRHVCGFASGKMVHVFDMSRTTLGDVRRAAHDKCLVYVNNVALHTRSDTARLRDYV